MRRTCIATGLALLALAFGVTDATAQHHDDPTFMLEVFGGAADYGDFLEQARLPDFALNAPVVFGTPVQRELTANTAFSLGGSVGAWIWEETVARLSFTWSPTELEFEDDTGTDSDVFDRDELGDLSVYALSLEALRFVLDPEENRLAPYINAGVAAGWWDFDPEEELDDDGALIRPGDGTEFRWGGIGGLGLQVRLSERLATRLEVSTFGLGNPFDGNESFRVADPEWFTFDEPGTARITRLTLGLAYNFGRNGMLLSQ